MPEILTRWLMTRYLTLWNKYGKKKDWFNFDQAKQILGDDSRVVSIFLSEIKKKGWLLVKIDPNDSRKRLYQLRPHEEVHNEIAKEVIKR